MHGFLLLLFFEAFLYCMRSFLESFPLEFSGYPSSLSQNLCLAAVVRLGGNGFSGYRDWGKWDPFTPRSFLD